MADVLAVCDEYRTWNWAMVDGSVTVAGGPIGSFADSVGPLRKGSCHEGQLPDKLEFDYFLIYTNLLSLQTRFSVGYFFLYPMRSS